MKRRLEWFWLRLKSWYIVDGKWISIRVVRETFSVSFFPIWWSWSHDSDPFYIELGPFSIVIDR